MINTREYNKKRFSIFESEEKTALELMNELGQACNEVLDRADQVENLANENKNKKVSYDDLHTKYQLATDGTNANFNGSWQGLKKPTLSQEGAFAQVEKNADDIKELSSQLDKKRDKSEKISQQDLDISSDTKKIQPYNLSDSVLSMMAGNTPVSAIIGDKSVTPEKTSFFKLAHNNLNNSSTETNGHSVNASDGTIEENSGYKVSDYIYVQEGLNYYVSQNFHMAFYNKDKTFISGKQGDTWSSPLAIPIGQNIAYARFTFSENKDSYVYKNENIDKYYSFGDYELEISDNKLEKAISSIKKPLDSLECFKNITNLFDINNIAGENTGISNVNGEVIEVDGYVASDYIKVIENNNYCCTRNYHIAFYNKNKEFIKGIAGNTWVNPITAPVNAYYVRFTMKSNDIEGMFVEGDTLPTKFYPYGSSLEFVSEDYRKSFINALGIYDSPLKGITWNVLGDSLSSVNYSRPNWWEIIRNKHEMIVNNYGISGTTMAHTNDRHLWDYDFGKLNASDIGYIADDPSTWSTGNCMCERFTKMNDNADLITVMGGTNDGNVPLGEWNSTDTSTTYGALNVLIKGLINKYPDKKIAFFTPIQGANDFDSNLPNPSAELDKKSPTDKTTLQLKVEAIKRKCKQYGIPCLDLYNGSGIIGFGNRRSIMYRPSDTLHPTEEGQRFMATAIENFIMTLFN